MPWPVTSPGRPEPLTTWTWHCWPRSYRFAPHPHRTPVPGGPGYPWTAAAAVDCMTVALKDPADPARTMLADPAARLLALAAAADPAAVAPVVATVIAPDTLHAWGMKAIRHLTRILPAIASKAPDLAIEIGAAPWQYEETRRTPTPMLGSAILELSSNLQQDVEGERYMVGTRFAELMRTDPTTATALLLSILQLPRLYQFAPERTGANRHLYVRAPLSRSPAGIRP